MIVMPHTVRDRSASTLLNTLELKPAKASIAINSEGSGPNPAEPADPVSLFFETLAAVGLSDKEAAYTMAMDPAQLSRVRNGQARLPFDAMWRLPDIFWLELRNRIETAKSLGAEHAHAIRAARIGELVRLLVEDVA